MHITKIFAAVSAAALLSLGLSVPASALVQQSYVVSGGTLLIGGGSINCESGCTVTTLDDGSQEIDTADGESFWTDGSGLYGAP